MNTQYYKEGYVIKDQFATHFLTFTVCGWVDLFTRQVYRDIVMDAFRYAQNQNNFILNAYVIMSNHIHIIGRSSEGQRKTLSDIIRDFKKYTHHQMLAVIDSSQKSRGNWMMRQFEYYGRTNPKNEQLQIWKNDSHPEECFSEDFTYGKLKYLHENPVRAGIVREPEDYIYSSASNYAGRGGIIEVVYL
jgi:putative transposase